LGDSGTIRKLNLNRSILADSKVKIGELNPVIAEEFLLIQAIGQGEEFAFCEIYKRYSRQVYNYMLRMVNDAAGAEDVMQEVFLAVWKGSHKFQQRSTPKTWIYRIAYHQAISWLRSHPKKQSSFDIGDEYEDDNSPEEAAIASGQSYLVRKAINQLPLKHRSVIELVFVQDMSYSEIAEVLDCPIGTVKSRMTYALRTMNQILSRMNMNKWNGLGEEG
jgi:RNA polymerase sigma-70 factor (ECF subfamily)